MMYTRLASTWGSAQYRHLKRRVGNIVLLSMFYGLAAGIVTLIGSLYGNEVLASLSIAINFPTFAVLFGVEWFLANPNGFSVLNGDMGTVTIVIGSIAVWSGIGSVVYGLVKMFKLGP